MYGYIYETKNVINGRVYVGKHMSDKYDPAYIGSGKILKQAIRKYGRQSFENRIICIADTAEELNRAEKKTIAEYSQLYGDALYNIASGGDGGDVFVHASAKAKQLFREKMTGINKERCASEQFRSALSLAGKRRYSDQNERDAQSERIRRAWADKDLRKKQSEMLRDYYKTHPQDKTYLKKRCSFILGEERIDFDSIKELSAYLHCKYGASLSRKTMHRLLESGEPYIPFHKNRCQELTGMRLILQNKSVETMGDECNPVGHEIGTCSKRKTEIEEIVHPA